MPCVMKAPDYEVMLLNISKLLGLHRIIAEHGHIIWMVIKRWLVRNDQILSTCDRLLQNLICIKKRSNDAGHGHIRITGFDRIHRVRWRSCTGCCDDSLDGSASCQWSINDLGSRNRDAGGSEN